MAIDWIHFGGELGPVDNGFVKKIRAVPITR